MDHKEYELHKQSLFLSRYQKYLAEFVYGGVDGSVTTFAVVAGAVGGGLDSAVILILGFANLIADGFSMSVGAYLSAKTQQDAFRKHERIEYWEVEAMPEQEREEIRQIFIEKGFAGPLLEQVVEVITSDKDRWVDVMMKEELGMARETRPPIMIGLSTFISFLLVGLVPLVVYVWDFLFGFESDLFLTTCVLTGIAFATVGFLKSYVNNTKNIRSILETVALGAIAALLAYLVGDLLEHLLN